MNLKLEQLRANTRRHFFKQSGLGFGAIALQQMLSAETAAAAKPRLSPHLLAAAAAICAGPGLWAGRRLSSYSILISTRSACL